MRHTSEATAADCWSTPTSSRRRWPRPTTSGRRGQLLRDDFERFVTRRRLGGLGGLGGFGGFGGLGGFGDFGRFGCFGRLGRLGRFGGLGGFGDFGGRRPDRDRLAIGNLPERVGSTILTTSVVESGDPPLNLSAQACVTHALRGSRPDVQARAQLNHVTDTTRGIEQGCHSVRVGILLAIQANSGDRHPFGAEGLPVVLSTHGHQCLEEAQCSQSVAPG
jgi:hypothetical protein